MTRSAGRRRPEKPLSALDQTTRRHYRHGSPYRRPFPNDAKPRPARGATIGTRGRRRARGHDGSSVARKTRLRRRRTDQIGPATRPTLRWTAHTDEPSGYRLCVTTRRHYRHARPLSAHVSNDAEPLSARRAIIGARARQREPPLAYAPTLRSHYWHA